MSLSEACREARMALFRWMTNTPAERDALDRLAEGILRVRQETPRHWLETFAPESAEQGDPDVPSDVEQAAAEAGSLRSRLLGIAPDSPAAERGRLMHDLEALESRWQRGEARPGRRDRYAVQQWFSNGYRCMCCFSDSSAEYETFLREEEAEQWLRRFLQQGTQRGSFGETTRRLVVDLATGETLGELRAEWPPVKKDAMKETWIRGHWRGDALEAHFPDSSTRAAE